MFLHLVAQPVHDQLSRILRAVHHGAPSPAGCGKPASQFERGHDDRRPGRAQAGHPGQFPDIPHPRQTLLIKGSARQLAGNTDSGAAP